MKALLKPSIIQLNNVPEFSDVGNSYHYDPETKILVRVGLTIADIEEYDEDEQYNIHRVGKDPLIIQKDDLDSSVQKWLCEKESNKVFVMQAGELLVSIKG